MWLVLPQPYIAGPGLTGADMHDNSLAQEWTPEQAGLVQRLNPCSQEDSIGFFIAIHQLESSMKDWKI